MKDECIKKCFSDIRDSDRYKMYKEIETVFGCESYMNCNIRRDVRVCFAKLRLSSHQYYCWMNCARWPKVKMSHIQRTRTLCNSNDIEDEYHVTLVCEHFRDVRKNIKPFYYHSIII